LRGHSTESLSLARGPDELALRRQHTDSRPVLSVHAAKQSLHDLDRIARVRKVQRHSRSIERHLARRPSDSETVYHRNGQGPRIRTFTFAPYLDPDQFVFIGPGMPHGLNRYAHAERLSDDPLDLGAMRRSMRPQRVNEDESRGQNSPRHKDNRSDDLAMGPLEHPCIPWANPSAAEIHNRSAEEAQVLV
jgi:hypothetical protein